MVWLPVHKALAYHIFFLQMIVLFSAKPQMMNVIAWNRFWKHMNVLLANNSIGRKPPYSLAITLHRRRRNPSNTVLVRKSSDSTKPTWDCPL